MASERQPDPERQRLGRLGALSVHARGRTNVAPARAAWEARLADEFGIGDELEPVERRHRMDFAMRIRMTKLAMARWDKKAAPAIETPGTAMPEVRHDRAAPTT